MKLPWRRNKRYDLQDEIQSHLDMAKQDRLDRGESNPDAAAAARREFGNVALVEHVTRDQWGWLWLEELLLDLRFGARTLRKNPGFTAVAVLTLALGIGANTSLFSVVNGVLLNPLPYPHPEQLVTLHESKPNFENGSISYPNFRDWQRDNTSFAAMAITRTYTFSLTGRGEAEQLRARFISSDFFSVLGVNPIIGRTFAPGEDEIGAAPIAIIGAGLWKRKFGESPDVLGKTLTLDGKDYTIVGVTPAAFDLFLRSVRITEVYVPIGQWNNPLLPKRGAGLGIHGIARLKPGVTVEQASADLQQISRSLAAAFPDTNNGITASMIPLRKDMLGNVQPVLLVLLGAVGFVLLIACVNVANLLLARSTGRAREFAIRSALGAGQGRLVRQLLTESVLLALAGGAIGATLAQWATSVMLSVMPAELPRAAEIRLDTHVLVFTMAVSLLAGILFGLAPALKTSQPRLHETLKESGRGCSGTRHRAQSIFVALETAMALVLLIGAGLMIRSLAALWNVDPGFRPDHVVTFGLTLPPSMITASPQAIRNYLRDLDNRLSATPGVQAVSQSWGAFPFGFDDEQLFWMDGQPKPANDNDMNWTLDYIVGPDYLRVMGIPLLRGRFLTPGDDEHTPLVGVVDEVFAHKYFGNEDPIGRRIIMSSIDLSSAGSKVKIVGVVPHVNQWGLDSDKTQSLRAQLYLPAMQMSDPYVANVPAGGGTYVIARGDGASSALLDALRQTSRQMNHDQVIYTPETMDEMISSTLAPRRFSMILLSVFAGLALVLSSVGIYGVISYLVGQRTHEIGLRMALGARHSDVLRLILGRGMKMAAGGVVVGIVAALALTQLMGKLLYGVSPTDPLTFVALAMALLVVALFACYMPARRAMRVDPMVALRHE
jgi:putative ABC transport system permease protein